MYAGPSGKHLNHRTQFTMMQMEGKKDPQVSMKNRKPFRTVQQKLSAKASAKKVDGRFVSPEPITFHKG